MIDPILWGCGLAVTGTTLMPSLSERGFFQGMQDTFGELTALFLLFAATLLIFGLTAGPWVWFGLSCLIFVFGVLTRIASWIDPI